MNKLIMEIFESLIYQQKDTQRTIQRLDVEIANLLKPFKEKYSESEYKAIRSLIYAIEAKSIQEGYRLGIRYALLYFISAISE